MCTVSMVGDHYTDKWRNRGWFTGEPQFPLPIPDGPSRKEFDALKKEVEDMRDLLKRAKEYDERTGQPNCEIDEKVALLKRVAELVGVDLSDVFQSPAVTD